MDSEQFGLFGRTSQGVSIPEIMPSDISSGDWLEPLFRLLDRIPTSPENGRVLGFSKDQRGGVRGACLTLNFSEAANCTAVELCRNAGSASSLSSVLEKKGVPVPQRCFLTREAKDGILARSERRGRKLPPMLDAALRE